MSNSLLRSGFYKDHRDFHATFDDGEYYLEYGLYGTVGLRAIEHDEIKRTSTRFWEIMNGVKDHIKTLSSGELTRLGYDERIHKFLKLDILSNSSVTSRFDIVRHNGSFKFIELNNDTPFLIMENYKMDELMATSLGKKPLDTRKREKLVSSFKKSMQESAEYLGKPLKECTVAIMGYGYEEDLEEFTTLSYYQSILTSLGINCAYLSYDDVRVDMDVRDVLSEKTGTIDILLKFAYPYEFLINDSYNDREGSIGIDLMKLMSDRKVVLLNPPATHILQNKGVFAYLYELVEHTDFFTYSDRQFIKKYVPYTSFSPDYFIEKEVDYVRKPVISREGQSVQIVQGNDVTSSSLNLYDDELFIYQEFIEIPTRNVVVEDTYKDLHEVIGVFIANNEYSGSVCRLGGLITDWYSHWIAFHME